MLERDTDLPPVKPTERCGQTTESPLHKGDTGLETFRDITGWVRVRADAKIHALSPLPTVMGERVEIMCLRRASSPG